MSISADYIIILTEGGHPIEDAITVASAMERGDDRDEMYALVDPMVCDGYPQSEIADAMVSLAEEIFARPPSYRIERRGPAQPDPYKERLGLSRGAWKRLRHSIFERDGRECRYCGSTDDLAVDHIVPLSRGGTNDPGNLCPACKPCNSSKRDKLLEEWLVYA